MGLMIPMPPRKGRPEKPYQPPARAWRWAAAGGLAGAVGALLYQGSQVDSHLGWLTDLGGTLLLGALFCALAGGVVAGILVLLRRAPWLWLSAILGSIVALYSMLSILSSAEEAPVFALALVVPPALLGGAVGLALDRGLRNPWVAGFLAATLLVGGGEVWWLTAPGPAAEPAAGVVEAETRPPVLTGPSPGARGAYEVRTLTYGAGSDRRRPEYGDRAALQTTPVDAAPLLPMWTGLRGRLRSAYWGFGPNQVPLNGRVWYPAGEGPYPLVLLVHGNHAMTTPSEAGYAYLGELLASRGYIVAAIDENFLGLSAFAGKLTGENGARAWLLLKHLEAWQRWNATVGTPFFRRVDLSNIALVGHSRGGEAAALASVFNDLPYLPGNGAVPLGFRFHIKAVAAIAPTDGQYRPAGQWPGLGAGVSYLALFGTQDADVSSFAGARIYERVRIPEGGSVIKAVVAIEGANHAQFNTEWGGTDWSGLAGLLLGKRAVMPGAQQRQIAAIYLSAFLEHTLRGNQAVRPLLQDARTGADWLPPGVAVRTTYQDGAFRVVSRFGEDLDLLTTTAAGGAQRGEGLKTWREQGTDPQGTNIALYLAWQTGGSYTLSLPDGPVGAAALSFALADARQPAPGLSPLDLTVELVTVGGASASLPLSHWARIAPPVPHRLTKLGPVEAVMAGQPDPLFQTYRLPLSDFGGLDPSQIQTIRFRFDRSSDGAILLDDVGFLLQR